MTPQSIKELIQRLEFLDKQFHVTHDTLTELVVSNKFIKWAIGGLFLLLSGLYFK